MCRLPAVTAVALAPDLARRLTESEVALWSGRPAQGVLLTPLDWLLIPFSMFWAGFTIFWEWNALRIPAPSFFPVFGIPFVLIGLFLLVGRFFVDAWVRRGVRYVVTNRRILIDRAQPLPKFIAIGIEQAANATLTEGAAGRGTIRFGEQPIWLQMRWGNWTPSLDPIPQFLAIEAAGDVFDLLQRLRAERERSR